MELKSLCFAAAFQSLVKSPWSISIVRTLKYHKEGTNKARHKIRDWRKVDHNPAKIPSAWIPNKWKEDNTIDYEREQQLAKYLPEYVPKVREEEDPIYNTEPLFQFSNNTKLVEGLNQSLCLTKSILIAGFPHSVQEHSEKAAHLCRDDRTIQAFRHAFLFDIDPENLDKENKAKLFKQDNYWIFPTAKRHCSLILENLIRLCQSYSSTLGCPLQRMISGDVKVSSVYRRACDLNYESASDLEKNWLISLDFYGGLHILSQEPLRTFADEDQVRETMSMDLPDIFPVFPIVDLLKTHIYDPQTSTGFISGFTHPHLHTLFITNVDEFTPDEMYAQITLQLFACLFSRAIYQYGASPMDLPHPIAAQVVAFDGKDYQFMCMQLNTTKLDCDGGIKNMVWIGSQNDASSSVAPSDGTLSMFEECSHRVWQSPDYYKGYNLEVMQTLLSFWLNGAA